MTIQMMKITEIKPYENNPRKNEEAVDEVASSIKAFGFKNPIIVDKDMVIIAGHTRLKAALKLGLTMVPVIVASDLNPDQANALRLADNKTAEIAKWDKKKLEEELKQINWEILGINMTDVGFDDIFASEFQEVVDDDFDEGQYLSAEPYSHQGDIYLLDDNRVMCGDSTNPEQVKVLMNGKLADMVFTDPPYNVAIGKRGQQYKEKGGYDCGMNDRTILNDDMGDAEFKEFLTIVFKNLIDSIKEGAPTYVCHADSEGINFRLAFMEAGFKLAQCIIWAKNTFTIGRQDYQWQHEPILYGWKPGSGHYFVDDRSQSTIWEYDKPKKNDLHPTMKPLELVGRAINNSSLVGQLVLDLFGGSGSTLIASYKAKRNCYSMELDEKYADVIVKRYIKNKGSYENCYVIRNGEQIPLNAIEDFLILE
jgi:DNA modification methylase